jgi:hypothetical protein
VTKVLDVPKMKGLIALPYEVLANIISNVDFDDVVSLGKTCKAFKFLRIEESICKSVVQVREPQVLVICPRDTVRYQIFSC